MVGRHLSGDRGNSALVLYHSSLDELEMGTLDEVKHTLNMLNELWKL